jgi:hypothetical protein
VSIFSSCGSYSLDAWTWAFTAVQLLQAYSSSDHDIAAANELALLLLIRLFVCRRHNGEILSGLLTCVVNVEKQPALEQQQQCRLLAPATAQQLTESDRYLPGGRQLLQFDVTLTAGEMRNIAEVMAGRYPY